MAGRSGHTRYMEAHAVGGSAAGWHSTVESPRLLVSGGSLNFG